MFFHKISVVSDQHFANHNDDYQMAAVHLKLSYYNLPSFGDEIVTKSRCVEVEEESRALNSQFTVAIVSDDPLSLIDFILEHTNDHLKDL